MSVHAMCGFFIGLHKRVQTRISVYIYMYVSVFVWRIKRMSENTGFALNIYKFIISFLFSVSFQFFFLHWNRYQTNEFIWCEPWIFITLAAHVLNGKIARIKQKNCKAIDRLMVARKQKSNKIKETKAILWNSRIHTKIFQNQMELCQNLDFVRQNQPWKEDHWAHFSVRVRCMRVSVNYEKCKHTQGGDW